MYAVLRGAVMCAKSPDDRHDVVDRLGGLTGSEGAALDCVTKKGQLGKKIVAL
jgi:hypothetical protein